MMLLVYVLSLLFIATQASVLPVPSSTHHVHTCENVLPHLLRLERTVAVLTTKLEEVDSVKSEIKSVKSQMKETSDGISASLEKAKTELFLNLSQIREHDVAYEAILSSDMTSVGDNIPFKFPNVVYNKGGGYSKTTGLFTAPVSGTYMFWAHIMVNDDTSVGVMLYKEHKEIARGYAPSGTRYGVASISTVLYLHKGDQIWLSKSFGSSRLRGENWSSYGGALLS